MKLLFLALLATIALVSAVDPPTWPSQYTVKGIFHVPLGNIREPVTVYYDDDNSRVKMEYYGGESTTLLRYDTHYAYEIVPRIDKLVCYKGASGQKPPQMTTVLPDLSSWTYKGTTRVLGKDVHNYQYLVDAPEPANYTSTYNFYVAVADNTPVRFDMKGYNMIWGAHPDIYSFVYHSFAPGVPDNVFEVPALCDSAEIMTKRRDYRMRARLGLVNALRPVESNDPFAHYAAFHNKVYKFDNELTSRRAIWERNVKFINEHNANPKKTNKLAINYFGDMTPEERRELFGSSVKRLENDGALYTHVFNSEDPLPPSVDWRKKNVVTEVKDQGVCGSCWTFGAVAVIESAYALKYGSLVSLSEQHILDCSYNMGNMGCDGGTAYAAYSWLMETPSGLATQSAYAYKMQNSYCKKPSFGVHIKGYVNVTSGDELALQHAVATIGPVTVAINTNDPAWYYHTGNGIYYNEKCPNGLDDLDHQVTIVGYGTQNGQDYWLVKNSYSTFWGDKGYIKMARNRGNNCGIATQPNYVLLQ